MSLEMKHFYDFENFRLDLAERILLCDGKALSVTPKAFHLLEILVKNHGRCVEKKKLLAEIWADSFVEDSNLPFNVRALRKILNDDAQDSKFIETVPRRGYRFIAPVKRISPEEFSDSESDVTNSENFRPQIDQSSFVEPNYHRGYLFLVLALAGLLLSVSFIGWKYTQGNTQSAAPILKAPFSSEKLSTDGQVPFAVISPDGKNVVYTNLSGDKQSIWVRQLDSSNNIEIIPPADVFYGGVAFSPDGSSIYFSRRAKLVEEKSDIYRVSVFGGIPTKIINQAEGWISVSPDGAKISFVRSGSQPDEYCSLWIADAVDGKNEKKIVSRPSPVHIADNKFTADGKSVIFVSGQTENSSNDCGLTEVNLETGAEHPLTTQKFFDIKRIVLLPKDDEFLITAAKSTERNLRIWLLSVPNDTATPLTKDSENYSFLSVDTAANALVSTQVEPDFHLILQNMQAPPDQRILADARQVSFAPNGKIVYSSRMTGNNQIWTMNADGSEKRQLTNDDAGNSDPIFAPDGNAIFFSSNRTGESNVWRMNLDGSNQMQITTKEGGKPLAVTSDGRWLYYHSGLKRQLWRVSTVGSGGGEKLLCDKTKYRFAISPDGLQFAFSEKQNGERYIRIVSTADGQIVKSFNYPSENRVPEITWTLDGKNLMYISSDSEFENNVLWRQPLDQETPQKVADLGNEQIESFALAPDGKNFAVVEGKWKSDAVLIKGLK